MTDKKITDLNAATSVVDTDLSVVVTDPGTTPETKKITIANLKTSLFDLAATIHAASSKNPPADADEIPIADSATSFTLKKLTWVNLKSTLKTYFDAFYGAGTLTGTGTNGKITKWTGATSLGDATNTDTDVADAVTKRHTQQHAITSTSDHTSTATSGQMLKANANGLPVDASNTDAQVASAVTNSPTSDQKAALAGTSGVPSATNKYVTDADSRNTDARTPTAAGLASTIHAATTKSPLDDADEFPIADSAGGYGLKRVLWSVIKSLLVSSVNKSGDTTLHGAVTLSPGTNITLSQVGQNIEISAPAPFSHQHIFQDDVTSQATGSNSTIYLTFAFVVNTTMVFLNGLLQRPGTDYTETPASGTLAFATNPNGVLIADYLYAGPGTTPAVASDWLLMQVFHLDWVFQTNGLALEIFQ